MKRIIIPFVGILLLCYGCSNKKQKTEERERSVTGNEVTLSAESPILHKLKIESITQSLYAPQFSTSGVVRSIPTTYAQIATPFAGRITKSHIRLGQSVQPGTPLFEISSADFFETGKNYFEAKQEMQQSLKNLQRERDLLANGVGVQKEVEEAEVNYQLKRQDYENARSALKVFQVDPEQIRLGEPLVVRAPIAGKIVNDQIVIGQYLKEDAEPLVTVADLTRVWVVAHVKEKDLRLIERLQQVDVRLAASPDEVIKGSVYHISEMLDPETRSVEVIILCDNRDGRMKPNMYGSVQLTDSETKAILIPTAAILQESEHKYTWIVEGDNRFRKTQITTGSVVGDRTVVLEGLTPGQRIISTGAYYLLDAK